MCGSDISFINRRLSLRFGGGGAISGDSDQTFYQCNANFDICSATVHIFNTIKFLKGESSCYIGIADDWRQALHRYHDYIDFLTDNPELEVRLMFHADENLRLVSDWSYLIPESL